MLDNPDLVPFVLPARQDRRRGRLRARDNEHPHFVRFKPAGKTDPGTQVMARFSSPMLQFLGFCQELIAALEVRVWPPEEWAGLDQQAKPAEAVYAGRGYWVSLRAVS